MAFSKYFWKWSDLRLSACSDFMSFCDEVLVSFNSGGKFSCSTTMTGLGAIVASANFSRTFSAAVCMVSSTDGVSVI